MAGPDNEALQTLFAATPTTKIEWLLWNRLMQELQGRLQSLEVLKDGLEGVLAQASDIALNRINEVLGPAIESIQADIVRVGELIDEAGETLDDAAAGAIAQIQPQIDAKLAQIDVALLAVTNAITAAQNSITIAVGQANSARDAANNAATAANNAAAGVAAAISAALGGTATAVNANRTGVAADRLYVDTSGSAISITLPANPATGNYLTIWRNGANVVNILRNGKTIEGVADDLVIDTDKQGVRLTYLFGTWKAFPAETVQ